ncbi:MAG: DUF2946 family protein [Leptothrix sp. (in: b-proteobacteria)]
MRSSSAHRLLSWLGICLVLLNVLVPTVSHALRSQDPGVRAAHRVTVLAMAGDWCVMNGKGQVSAAELKVLDAGVTLQTAVDQLSACDFCADHGPLAAALPLPTVDAPLPPLALSEARVVAYADTLLRRPAHERPASRAPPQA